MNPTATQQAAINAVKAIAPWTRRAGLTLRVEHVGQHPASGLVRAFVFCGTHTWKVTGIGTDAITARDW